MFYSDKFKKMNFRKTIKALFFPAILTSTALIFSSFVISDEAIVEIKITDVRTTTGSFVLGFYKDNDTFTKRTPYMRKKIEKTTQKNGMVVYNLSMPAGTYGIALLDDENQNGKMDYGFILPLEGFGFSDYFHKGLSSPSFQDFDFTVGGSNKSVVIKVKYM